MTAPFAFGDAADTGSIATLVEWDRSCPLADTIADNREVIGEALYSRGALLFRDTGVTDAPAFERITRALAPKLMSYVGGATPRSRISGEVYTSTEYAASAHLQMHNEESYLPEVPGMIWFFCAVPSAAGGETPLGDMSRVLDRLDPALVDRFTANGLCYVTNLHGGDGFGKSWQATYMSTDRDEVEAHLRDKQLEYTWQPNGSLRVLMRAPALRTHSVTGKVAWGNQVANWHEAGLPASTRAALNRTYGDPWNHPKAVFFGDGGPIPAEDTEAVSNALMAEETTFAWRAGDVLLVDNQAIAHGRRPFTGKRQIMVALA